jgi:hypothetical protein
MTGIANLAERRRKEQYLAPWLYCISIFQEQANDPL